MALGRQILDRPLDAAGNAVAGLPHAATGDAAERHDDVVAGDTANATAISVEIAARIAGDAAHPGTITALTGDVAASGTGSVAATLTNLPQAVLLARLAALTADPAFNSRKLTLLADGVAATDAATVGQIAAGAFTVANNAALVAVDASRIGDGASRRVTTYRDWFDLDKVTPRTAVPDVIIAASGGSGWWWVRRRDPDPSWHLQLSWTVNASTGNDENLGDSTHPLRTRSEFYRRLGSVALAAGTFNVQIATTLAVDDVERPAFLSDTSAVSGSSAFIKFTGTRRVLFTGTIDSPSGVTNRNGSTSTHTAIKVSGLPSTWTAGDGTTSFLDPGVVITDGTLYARPVQDMGTKTAWTCAPITLGNIEGTFAPGASITIYDVPSLGHDEFCPLGHVEYVDLKVSGGRFLSMAGTIFQTNCSGDVIAEGSGFSSSNGRTGIGAGQSFIAQGCAASVTGGFHRLIMPNGTGCRINVCPTLIALQIEVGSTVATLTQVAGAPQIAVDLEFCTSPNLDSIIFNGINGARLVVAGYVYGANNGTGYGVMMQGLGGHAQFAHVPQISGTNGGSANFQLTSTVVALSTLATQSLTDINNNRIDGPAGPTWNDNRSAPTAHLGSGGTTPTNAANIGDVLALAPTGISAANEAALTALDATILGTGTRAWVRTYRCFWTLDKVTTRTALANRVIAATGGSGWWWVRELAQGDPFWQAQTAWWIDPAGTNSTPGNDEADGLSSSTPIKSIAEWRRRIRGADFQTTVVINALSGSSALDDGVFYGFTTVVTAANVIVMGATTVVGSGTLTSGTSAGYVGNARAQVVDSSLPSSWTASYGIGSSSGSRYIRKVGGGVNAPLILDQGSKTAMIGLATDTSETSTAAPTATIVHFNSGDAYEVTTRVKWPPLLTFGVRVQLQCLDISGQHFVVNKSTRDRYVLCGYLNNATSLDGQVAFYNCCFFGTWVGQSGSLVAIACSFVGGNAVEIITATDWSGQENVFLVSHMDNHHGCNIPGVGTLRFFDVTATCLNVTRGSIANLSDGGVVGSGNSGAIVATVNGGRVTNGSLVTATTSGTTFSINGVASATPYFDAGAGTGVYT